MFTGVGLMDATDKNIPSLLRGFGNDNGVYLESVELQNWGPFSGLTEIPLLGMPALLVGENGTGKSSLMDAILTLLISKGLRYNSASDNKTNRSDERSLMEYVLGVSESKLSDDGEGFTKKTRYLRKTGEISIVLLRFRTGTEFMTLANVFLANESQKEPQRFYVFAGRPLSILGDFSVQAESFEEYRGAIGRLKGVTATADRARYFAFVRDNIGLTDDNSMRLLRSLSSMKSLPKPDEFIRAHMLRNGDDLWAAYDGMKTAISDMEEVGRKLMDEQKRCRMLETLVPCIKKAQGLQAEADLWGALPVKVQPFVYEKGKEAAAREIRLLEEKQALLEKRIQTLENKKDNNTKIQARLEAKRDNEGGATLAAKKAELDSFFAEKARRETLYNQFSSIAGRLGLLADIPTEYVFKETLDGINKKRSESDRIYEEKLSSRREAETIMNKAAERLRILEAEKRRLAKDMTAVDGRLVAVRDEICEALGVGKDAMPFLGSFLSVKEEDEKWRPALEHLLYRKSVSFLVRPDMLPRVTAYLKRHKRSGMDIGYLAMKPVKKIPGGNEEKAAWKKIGVRQGTPFTEWVEEYLRFFAVNRCCDTPEEFAQHYPAIMEDGQIRQNKVVHRKNETIDIFNPNNFMMSGSFEERLKALDKDIVSAGEAVSDTRRGFVAADAALRKVKEEKALLDKVPYISSFADIDVDTVNNKIEDCETVIRELEQDRKLEEINVRIAEIEEKQKDIVSGIEKNREEMKPVIEALGYIRNQSEVYEKQLSGVTFTEEEKTVLGGLYDRYKPDAQNPKFASVIEVSPKISARVTRRMKEIMPELERARSEAEKQQREYLDEFRGRRSELEPGLSMAQAWTAELEKSKDEFLPAAKEAYDRIVDYQNLGAVKRFIIAANMDQEIKKAIDDVNRILRQVPYSQGTYPTFLQVNCLPNRDGEVAALRRILSNIAKACRTEDISEVKPEEAEAVFNATAELTAFLEAKKIRIRKETYSEDNILDQRNWYVFPVSVCREEVMGNGETEIVHVKELDKTNKQSSGEGEKFTYFILAACFAIWMHLLDKDYAGRTFRFLMIDEIGNKLSPSNLRDVISLFALLRIQLVSILPQGDKVSEYEGFVGNIIQTDWLDKSVGTSFVDTLSLTGYAKRNRERTEDRIRQGRDALARAKAVIDDVNNGKDKS